MKLLRVLQEREFERVGGIHTIKVDIRLIAATNRDLSEAVRLGLFRQDLYYRLAVVKVTMPPLNERRETSPCSHGISCKSMRSGARYGRGRYRARPWLSCVNYDWPGNVRELENAIERALVMGSTDMVLIEDLPESLLEHAPSLNVSDGKYHANVMELKKQMILDAVLQTRGNYVEAAGVLGVHPNYLHRLIRNLGLKDAIRDLLREMPRTAAPGKLRLAASSRARAKYFCDTIGGRCPEPGPKRHDSGGVSSHEDVEVLPAGPPYSGSRRALLRGRFDLARVSRDCNTFDCRGHPGPNRAKPGDSRFRAQSEESN